MNNNFLQINAQDFKKELQDKDVVLIDVRTSQELFIYWKIRENQLHIDMSLEDFVFEIAKLDKKKKYLIYCWHWNRTQVVREYMKSQWFIYVKDLEGGIDVWNF